MTHLSEPQWRGSNRPSGLAGTDWRAALPTWAQHAQEPPPQRRELVWVLRCDAKQQDGELCGNECWNDGADPDYATYVPDAWRINGDGTHTCPDCQSMAERGHLAACAEDGRCICERVR